MSIKLLPPKIWIVLRATLFLPLLMISPSLLADAPSPPMCRIDKTHFEAVPGNAGCIIRVGKTFLTITHRLTRKYDIPGGRSNGETESAQCTAHRETWEETGFNVEVGPLLGVNENRFRYYGCTLDDDFDGKILDFPLPEWAENEVVAIQFVDLFDTQHFHWRYPDQLILLRDMFNKLGKIQKQKAQKKRTENPSSTLKNPTASE